MPLLMDHSSDEIKENSTFSYRYVISNEIYRALISDFGDTSPLHVDEAYARSAGFSGCVMHAAIYHGFLSHFVGTYFPGRRSLLLSASLNYHNPSYLNDEIELRATVRHKVESTRVIALNVEFVNMSSRSKVASGRVQVALRDE